MINKAYTLVDLFSGSGAFSLAFERTGHFKTELFCDNDEFSKKTIVKNFEDAYIYHDIKSLKDDYKVIDSLKNKKSVVTLGFPCQDISIGGAQVGIRGSRSGLWKSAYEFCKKIRPHFIVIENVERLLKGKGMGVVLKDLSDMGYDAEWSVVSAQNVGLPHKRLRVFIVAYPKGKDIKIFKKNMFLGHQEKNLKARDDLMKMIRARPKLSRKELEDARKKRIEQIGNSIIPDIANAIAKSILEKSFDDFEEKTPITPIGALSEEELHTTRFPNRGVLRSGRVYEQEDIFKVKRDNKGELFPTIVSSDKIDALGVNDTYKLTRNGRVRRYSKNGSDASLNLSRFVKFFHKGKLNTDKLPVPKDLSLCPDFGEALMGFPKGWTDHKEGK